MPTLNWLNREEALGISKNVPYRLLKAEFQYDYGDHRSNNILVQGDNLEALKALLPYYGGCIKCIYIDPPYNTQSAFDQYDDNLEHSTWLTMMYPRLELLRDLLGEDGSIWISIDDHEGQYLKVIMDEVFGRNNFLTTIIWRKNYSPKSTAKYFSEDHDYILVYAKYKENWQRNLMPRTEKQNRRYRNIDNDPRGAWKPGGLDARNYYSEGTYPITTPSGREIPGPPNGAYWRYSKEKLEELDKDNRIWWGKDGNNVPAVKRFLGEVQQGIVPQTLWNYKEVGHTQEAKKESVGLFGSEPFGTPKPERLIQRIIHIATNPGDIVLDSFLGSGTTTAVAQKMNRRYIGIEMGEHAITHCAQRLIKVIDGEQGGISIDVKWQGGGGFHFCKLGDTVFLPDGAINPKISFNVLAAHIWFSETNTPLRQEKKRNEESPLLGIHNGTAYYLLYNGVLKDKSVTGGNVLTSRTLRALPLFDGPKVIYGAGCRFSPRRLEDENIVFKQTPYEIKSR